MIELTICGLAGMAAMLVVAFYFAYHDEFRLKRERASLDPSDYGDRGGFGRGRTTVYSDRDNAEGSHG
jgi:hypothetical protein